MPYPAELKTQYLALQQDADFSLWRAREANIELRKAYQAHLAGGGEPPSPAQLEQVRELEAIAETSYRELRSFVRAHFEQSAVTP